MQIDCTQPIVISATGQDAEGNTVTIPVDQLQLSLGGNSAPNFGVFGAMNGDTFVQRTEGDTRPWAFNPGDAGATGSIIGEVDIAGQPYKDELDLELVPGALRSIKLNMVPVPIPGPAPTGDGSGNPATPAETTGSGSTETVTPSEVGDAGAVLDNGSGNPA